MESDSAKYSDLGLFSFFSWSFQSYLAVSKRIGFYSDSFDPKATQRVKRNLATKQQQPVYQQPMCQIMHQFIMLCT